MKQEKTPYQIYLDETELQFQALVKDYEKRIEKAREGFKKKVHYEFWNYITREEHLLIQRELGKYSHFIFQIKDEMENDKDAEFDILFNQKIVTAADTDSSTLLQNLSKLQALNNLIEYLQVRGKNYHESEPSQIHDKKTGSNLQWKGKTELEFVQLIYALHEAGFLENEEGEITTLVKQVANIFNFELGKNWQSNHSESVNDRNADYESKIFGKLAKAYASYREKLIDTKNKTTPK